MYFEVVNRLPTVTKRLPNLTLEVGESFTYAMRLNETFFDPESNDILINGVASQSANLVLALEPTGDAFSGTAPASPEVVEVVVNFTDACLKDSQYGNLTLFITVIDSVQLAINHPPQLVAPLLPQSIWDYKFASYDITGQFADPDEGDALTYVATLSNGSALPSWVSFSNQTQIFWLAPKCVNESIEVKVTATDPEGATAEGTFEVGVINELPSVKTHIPQQRLFRGESLLYHLHTYQIFQDLEGDLISVAPNNPALAWLAWSPTDNVLSGAPPADGLYDISIEYYDHCHDPAAFNKTYSFQLLVTNNSPPECAQCGTILVNMTNHVNNYFFLMLQKNYFADADQDEISYEMYLINGTVVTRLNVVNTWLRFDPINLKLYGTPRLADLVVQFFDLSFQFKDSYHAPVAFNFSVNVTNEEPAINEAVVASLKRVVHTGDRYQQIIDKSLCVDGDGDLLTIEVLALNEQTGVFEELHRHFAWLSFDATALKLSGQPQLIQNFTVRITCTDSFSEVKNSSDIPFCVYNNPPTTVITDALQAYYHPLKQFSYAIPSTSFVDQDLDLLHFSVVCEVEGATFKVSEKYSWLVFKQEGYILYGVPPNLFQDPILLRIEYTDKFSDASFVELNISMNNSAVDFLPASDVIDYGAQSLSQLFSFRVDSSWFYDADNDAIYLEVRALNLADQSTAPLASKYPWLSFNTTSHVVAGTPADQIYLGEGALMVLYSDQLSAWQNFTVTFNLTNTPPSNNSDFLPELSYPTGSPISYRIDDKFVDADGDRILFEVYALDENNSTVIVDTKYPWLSLVSVNQRLILQGTPRLVQNITIAIQFTDSFSAVQVQHVRFIVFNVKPVCDFGNLSCEKHYQRYFQINIPVSGCRDNEGDKILMQLKVLMNESDYYDVATYLQWLQFDDANYKIFGSTNKKEHFKNLTLALFFFDSYSEADKQVYLFNLTYINQRPRINGLAIPLQELHVGTSFSFYLYSNYFVDDDGDPLTYEVYALNLGSNQTMDPIFFTKWAQFDATKNLIYGRPDTCDHVKNYTLVVSYSDIQETEYTYLNVSVYNNFPRCLRAPDGNGFFDVIIQQTNVQLEYFIDTTQFMDEDFDTVYFEVFNYESEVKTETQWTAPWLKFDMQQRKLYGTPSFRHAYTLLLYFFDGYEPYDQRQSVKLMINVINKEPYYLGPKIEIACFANKWCQYSIQTVDFKDPENDELSFDLKVKQSSGISPYNLTFSWLRFSQNNKQLFGLPKFEDIGQYQLLFEYTDGNTVCTQEATFYIRNNRPVQIKQFGVQRVHAGNLFQYVIPLSHFYDTDGNTVIIQGVQQRVQTTFQDLYVNLPWLTFTPASNLLSGVSDKFTQGSFDLAIRFTDQSSSTLEDCGSAILPLVIYNNAPLVQLSVPNYRAVLNQYTYIAIDEATFMDIDHDPMSYSLYEIKSGLKTDIPTQWIQFQPKSLLATVFVPKEYKIAYNADN